jgi:hypothetical protein
LALRSRFSALIPFSFFKTEIKHRPKVKKQKQHSSIRKYLLSLVESSNLDNSYHCGNKRSSTALINN